MKSRSLIIMLFLSLVTITSCNKNDDDVREDEILNGTWNLSIFSGGLSGPEKIPPGEVVLTFNEEDNHLVVENRFWGDEFEGGIPGLSSGTYEYEVVENEEYQILYVEGEKLGNLFLEPGILHIDGGRALDGPFYVLMRYTQAQLKSHYFQIFI